MEKQYLEGHLPISSVRVLEGDRAALSPGCSQVKQRATYSKHMGTRAKDGGRPGDRRQTWSGMGKEIMGKKALGLFLKGSSRQMK